MSATASTSAKDPTPSGSSNPTTNKSIQLIVEAEQQANKIIEEARQYRHTRVKQARESAMAEIQLLKQQLESDYQKFVAEQETQLEEKIKQVKEKNTQDGAEMRERAEQGKDKVVKMLIDAVTNYVLTEEELDECIKAKN
jgi:V-type H+-transporting ATPase subunit G